jgi:hypothetical protein
MRIEYSAFRLERLDENKSNKSCRPVEFFVEEERSVFNWGLPNLSCSTRSLFNRDEIFVALILSGLNLC